MGEGRAQLLWKVPPWAWALAMVSLLLGILFFFTIPQAGEGVIRIKEARAYSLQQPGITKQVQLPHNLDYETSEWRQGARYEVDLPQEELAKNTKEYRYALLLPRVGTRFRVSLNGQEIYEFGWRRLGEETILASSIPHYVLLPTDLLAVDGPSNRLVIEVQGQPLKRSGLWQFDAGDSRLIYQKFRLLDFMQVTSTWMVGLVSLLVGVLSLIVWLLFRERLFGLIFFAGVAHAARSYFLAVSESPFSYDTHFILSRVAIGTYVAFFLLMLEEIFGGSFHWIRRLIWAGLALLVATTYLAARTRHFDYVQTWDVLQLAIACVVFLWIGFDRLKHRELNRAQGFVSVVAMFVLIAGIRDLLVLQMSFPGDGDIRWMSVAGLATMLALGWLLLDRSLGWAAEVHRLNATLDQRIKDKENEMRQVFKNLERAKMQQAADSERRRLMREMHDGLGSHLVQTLNYLQNSGPQVDSAKLSGMVVVALTDLRLTLDSLEQHDGDIPAILGTLRGRIGPSLEAAGIRLHWDVEDVSPLNYLDARGVMHVFRCLQEIFANAVKHAGAHNIYVRSWQDEAGVHIAVEDDGVGAGISPTSLFSGGLGLRNIEARTRKIGAVVRLYDVKPGFGIEMIFRLNGKKTDLEPDWQPTNFSTTLAPD